MAAQMTSNANHQDMNVVFANMLQSSSQQNPLFYLLQSMVQCLPSSVPPSSLPKDTLSQSSQPSSGVSAATIFPGTVPSRTIPPISDTQNIPTLNVFPPCAPNSSIPQPQTLPQLGVKISTPLMTNRHTPLGPDEAYYHLQNESKYTDNILDFAKGRGGEVYIYKSDNIVNMKDWSRA